MNIKKRLLALVMALAMVLTYMPAVAFAEGESDTDNPGASDSGDAYSFVAPVSAEPLKGEDGYVKGIASGEIGTDFVKYTGGYGFTVEYSDGTKIDYIYGEGTYTGDDGEVVDYEGFYKKDSDVRDMENYLGVIVDDEKGAPVFKKGWNKGVKMLLSVPCWAVSQMTGEKIYDNYVEYINTDINVWCSYRTPVSAKFVPAEGFQIEGNIGYNYIDESDFYGEGNAFVVTYDDLFVEPDSDTDMYLEYETTYRYVKTKDGEEGFYEDSNVDHERFSLSEDSVEVWLKKGKNKVTIPFYAFATGAEEPTELKLKVEVVATKLNAYANWPVFDYTGKYITKSQYAKKLVVKDSNDKVIPSSAYTFTWKKQKKMGWYTVKIKFKDKTKYVDSITAEFGIGPKTPVINKVRGGKKKLIVTWKKFTKAQLKNIDGIYIEIAQNKNFSKDYKLIKVPKKSMKKYNKIIKKLAGNKKYYVRLSSYKKIKQGKESYYMFSSDSKVKSAKTKK